MRVKHQPMPQQTPPPQQQAKGPTTNGSRQAQQLDYLRRFRNATQGGGKSGVAGRGAKGSRAAASEEAMLLTDLDEALDESYDRLLGRHKRHQGRRDEEEANGEEESSDSPFSPFRVKPVRLRG